MPSKPFGFSAMFLLVILSYISLQAGDIFSFFTVFPGEATAVQERT